MNSRLQTMLKQPERTVKIHEKTKHLLTDLSIEDLDILELEALTAKRTGDLLQTARKSRHLTQKQLAVKLGRTQSRVATLERPGNEIALSSVVRFAHALGYNVTMKLEPKEGGVALETKL